MTFFGLFLDQDLTPTESWTHLCGSIVNGGMEVDFRPIIDCICVALTLKARDEKSPLAMLQPTVPLENRDILRHIHHMLTRHLPRMDPDLQRFQGLLIDAHIGEVAVDLSRDREAMALARKAGKEK